MSVFDCVEERLLLCTGIAYHGYGLWPWYFSGSGELFYTTCPYKKELQMFFELGKCLDYAMAQKDAPMVPFLMSDGIGLIWLGEYVPNKDPNGRFVVLGPAFQDQASVFGISDALNRLNLSHELRHKCMNMLQDLPVVDFGQFQCLAKSLHYTIGFTDTQNLKLRLQNQEQCGGEGVLAAQPADYERKNHREQMILQFIRDGNVRDGNKGYSDLLDLYTRSEWNTSWSKSPDRTAKNALLIFTSQCAQAAIDGGLPVQDARETEEEFCGRIERQRTATDLVNLCKEMVDAFTERVAQRKEYTECSQPIYLCCAYIKKHLSEPITLKFMADQLGYTEYYLARKFQKETGVRLLDYIRQTRLEYAKILLTTTSLSIQQISERLQFGTRNYFTRVFKEYAGISPSDYRSSAWNRQRESMKS